jgi:alpha-L-arabinofuranosidase
MKRVDPSIQLTASTGWAKEWYEGVLASKEDYFDHISAHTYDRLIKDFSGEAGLREFRRLADAPRAAFLGTGLEHGEQGGRRLTLRDIRDLVNARPCGRKDIGIAFDEWNVWYSWYREPGLPEAIYGAAMLNHIVREARNVGMSIGAFFEPVNEGAILVRPDGARLTPLGRVMALFRPHHAGRLIHADPASAGDLDLAASLDAANARVTITIVNMSPVAGRDARVVLSGTGTLGAPQAILLTADAFTPGADMREEVLEVRRESPDTLALAIPKHSVARIQVSFRPHGP